MAHGAAARALGRGQAAASRGALTLLLAATVQTLRARARTARVQPSSLVACAPLARRPLPTVCVYGHGAGRRLEHVRVTGRLPVARQARGRRKGV